ncbi:pectinesterase/pectinesterase inhibitor ppe8b [Phtheirospermum japonicum]|uniref:Pectinesterase n=1 Tax=Phtheirospermum japonicum TaxID=374723 RepID=A0A830BCN5_9LAMI|nr:pectinesterase/pectinesterase inhibitor ppe8b [Phtheirospermum japonicum]
MASDEYLKSMVVVVLVLLCCSGCGESDASQSLKIPVSMFVGSVSSTIETLHHQVIPNVSKFAQAFTDLRLKNAIADCLELMDLSMDQLSFTRAASLDLNGTSNNGTGDVSADMKTWLSAALINQVTCLDGFEGTHHNVSYVIAGHLDKITSSVLNMLSNVTTTNSTTPPPKKEGRGLGGRKLIGGDKFPDWLGSRDRNLLEAASINGTVVADAVVAADGTGNFTTIEEALGAAPNNSDQRYVIHIKRGVYKEYLEISKKKKNIMMIGDGIDVTVISGNRSFVDGWTTYRSATFALKGWGFMARDITFENTAGPEKHQAVAFRSDSDLSVMYRCAFRGYQDTLYAHSLRQFYRECQITGTIDFIFGDAAAVFQNCDIRARQGLPNQKNAVTAQGRKDPFENTGFSIQFCNISAEPGVLNTTQTYLGRPWKPYSRTVIMQSNISDAIRPEGWLEWNGNVSLDTLFYAEYLNTGPGAAMGARVKWPGYRILNTSAQASNFTVSRFLMGDDWLPSTGVKYTSGLVASGRM